MLSILFLSLSKFEDAGIMVMGIDGFGGYENMGELASDVSTREV